MKNSHEHELLYDPVSTKKVRLMSHDTFMTNGLDWGTTIHHFIRLISNQYNTFLSFSGLIIWFYPKFHSAYFMLLVDSHRVKIRFISFTGNL
jgi:hypothetical protein